MLVAVHHGNGARGDGLSGAEARVAQWMRSWTGDFALPGVTVFNAALPSGTVDAVVLSPYGCVVLEIDSFTRRQDGILHTPATGTWQIDDEPAALHIANPREQVHTNLLAVRKTLQGAGINVGVVPGLVVLLPTAGARVDLGGESSSDDIAVVLAPHQKPLRQYFHALGRGPKIWDANTVNAAARALKITEHVPNALELYQHGIPETIYLAPEEAAPEPAKPRAPAKPPPEAHAPASPTAGRVRLAALIVLGLLALAGLIWVVSAVYTTFHG